MQIAARLTSQAPAAAPAGVRASWFPWMHRAALLGVIVTLLFPVLSGGIVTSLDVGMAYNTWPGVYDLGFVTAPFSEIQEMAGTGGVVEHSHRLAGTLLGCVALLAWMVALITKGVPSSWRWLSFGIGVMVLVQGLLGRARVLENERAIAVFHALGAQLVLVAFVAMAKLSARSWSEPATHRSPDTPRLRLWTGVSLAVLFVHSYAGAGLRHQQASFEGHVILAVAVSFCLLAIAYTVFSSFGDRPALRRGAKQLVALLGLQLALGLATWAFKHGPLVENASVALHATLATTHLVAGALVTAVTAGLAMEARHRVLPASRSAQEATI